MNKSVIIVALLLLTGAGCTSAPQAKPQTKSATAETQPQVDIATEPASQKTASSDFSLTAERISPTRVKLTWTIPEDMKHNPEGFRIVRGPNENPIHPGNYWFHQPNTRTSVTWINLPTRTEHFRICRFEHKKCVEYSNNVIVEKE